MADNIDPDIVEELEALDPPDAVDIATEHELRAILSALAPQQAELRALAPQMRGRVMDQLQRERDAVSVAPLLTRKRPWRVAAGLAAAAVLVLGAAVFYSAANPAAPAAPAYPARQTLDLLSKTENGASISLPAGDFAGAFRIKKAMRLESAGGIVRLGTSTAS